MNKAADSSEEFERFCWIVTVSMREVGFGQEKFRQALKVHQTTVSRLIRGELKNGASRAEMISVCQTEWHHAIERGHRSEEEMIRLFGTTKLTEARLDQIRQRIWNSDREELVKELEAIEDQIAHRTFKAGTVEHNASLLVMAVAQIRREDNDLTELACRVATKFIDASNMYPPEAKRKWHRKLAVLGGNVLDVLKPENGETRMRLEWVTALAHHASGDLNRAGARLESCVGRLEKVRHVVPRDLSLAVLCDHARLLTTMGEFKQAVEASRRAQTEARKEPFDSFRLFVATENEAFALAALGRFRKASDLLSADHFARERVDEAALPPPSALSLLAGRAVIAALSGDLDRARFRSILLELRTEARDRYQLTAFAALYDCVLKETDSARSDDDAFENARCRLTLHR